MRKLILPFAIALLVGAFAASAGAQTALGTLRGNALDEQGAALPGVTITARETQTNTVASTVTGGHGEYLLTNLRPGKYELSAELTGFQSHRQALELRVGEDLTVTFTMKIAGLTQSVEVVGESVPVQTQSTVGTVISNKQIDDLPTISRDFSALAKLSPGTTQSGMTGATAAGTGISISGMRPYQNNIVVDGASNLMQFYGRQANDFPQDWIQEFQVLTNSFGAEFGQAAGGVMNVITRSGSNAFGGRVYGFFRDAKLDSPPFAGRYDPNGEPVFLDETPPFDQQRLGGFLGGPVRRDSVFFFGGIESLNLDSSEVLALSNYWRAALPNEPTIIPKGTDSNVYLAKVDWNVSQNNRMYFRYTNTDKSDKNVSLGTSALDTLETRYTFEGPLWNVLGNWTSTFTQRAFNELRVFYGVNKPWILANHANGLGGSLLLDADGANGLNGRFAYRSYPGANFGATSFTGLEGESNAYIIDNFSFIMGHHSIKTGVQLSRLTMFMDVEASHKGRWGFLTDRVFNINDPASYPNSFSGNVATGKATLTAWNPSVYIQDTWQPTGNLTLNLGLRYDLDRTPATVNSYIDPYNEKTVARLGGAPPLQKSKLDTNNVSPRLGFVWVPTADRRTTIRGSYGLFYDQNHFNWTDIYVNETLLSTRRVSFNATSPADNPFYNPADPTGSRDRLRRFLAEAFPAYPDLSVAPYGTEQILGIAPDFKIPYSGTFSVGVTHDFGTKLTTRADYVNTRLFDAAVSIDTNWTQTADGRFVRADPRFGRKTFVGNRSLTGQKGELTYNGLHMRAEWVPAAASRVGLSYTLSKGEGNVVSTLSTAANTNPFDLDEDFGPDNNDRRHNLVLDGSYMIPRIDVQAAGILSYRSALPYNVTTALQLDSDPFSDLPEGRNPRRGDSEKNLDLRLSKVFRIGRTSTWVYWEMYNALNTDNYFGFQGSLQSPIFSRPTTELPKRRQQFGLRFDF
ncbi:MAG TPA: carboxypeptidase regulatory-like domain-containing protein [Vicinamibacterales bacterium]|nr:carboxypeptidase regulatory-like domain-containing protein [Vicinamibacterales bacterium]